MIQFPHCKINLGLQVLAKRHDGYHDLNTVFVPIRFHDVLEIRPACVDQSAPVQLEVTGMEVTAQPEDNLCVKAWQLLKKDFPQLPPLHMHLHKVIPAGAGLGGGSADAAFTLFMLNTIFQLELTNQQLEQYALALGSDCPFFLHRQPLLATGRGEVFTPVQLTLDGYHIVLITTPIHINTGWAFSQIKPQAEQIDLKMIVAQPIHDWRSSLSNDFEAPVFAAHPVLQGIKDMLYQNGALYASMTGSGSTLFGLFDAKTALSLLPDGFTAIWTEALTFSCNGQ